MWMTAGGGRRVCLEAAVLASRAGLGAVLASHLPLRPGFRAMKLKPLLSRHCPQAEPGVSNRGDWPFSEDLMALTRGCGGGRFLGWETICPLWRTLAMVGSVE